MKTNTFEGALLDLYWQNQDIPNLGDATGVRGATTAGSLYLSLHTAYPGEAGSQTTSETTYPSYARKAVARSGAEWSRSGNTVQNLNSQAWPTCSGASGEICYFVGVGRSSAGAGTLDHILPLGTLLGEGAAFPTTDIITIPGLSGVSVNDPVAFFTLPTTGAMPGGITAGTVYYAKTVSGNDITISATVGGATLDITSAGAVLAWKLSPITVNLNSTPTIAVGALTYREE